MTQQAVAPVLIDADQLRAERTGRDRDLGGERAGVVDPPLT